MTASQRVAVKRILMFNVCGRLVGCGWEREKDERELKAWQSAFEGQSVRGGHHQPQDVAQPEL
jgi:hypothetical protein